MRDAILYRLDRLIFSLLVRRSEFRTTKGLAYCGACTARGGRTALELYALQHRLVCRLEAGKFRFRRDEDEKDHHTVRLWEGNQPVALELLLAISRGEGRSRLHHHRTALGSANADGFGVAHKSYAVGPFQLLHQLRRDVIHVDTLAVRLRGVEQHSIAHTVGRDSSLGSDGKVVRLILWWGYGPVLRAHDLYESEVDRNHALAGEDALQRDRTRTGR